MKFMTFLSALLIFFCMPAFATKFYRHLPFTIMITALDTIVVDYDFSEKNGVKCIANTNQAAVDFTYKGKQKTANLPAILQSDHVPDQAHEELADNDGQFNIEIDETKLTLGKNYRISCQFIDHRKLG